MDNCLAIPEYGVKSLSSIRESDQLSNLFHPLTAITLGILLGLGGLNWMFSGQQTKFDELGLGIGTSVSFQTYKKKFIHCQTFGSNLANAQKCLDDSLVDNNQKQIVWLGASQLHGINNYHEGDKTAPWLVHDKLLQQKYSLITFSQPNANLQEHYVLYTYLKNKMPISGLIIAAVLDDMRENGIRHAITSAFDNSQVVTELQQTEIGSSIYNRYHQDQVPASELSGLTDSPQEKVERTLTGWLEENWPLWRARLEGRGQLFITLKNIDKGFTRLRNTVLGIDGTKWQVAIPKAQYDVNFSAIEAILENAQESGISVFLYIAPRPINAHFPYDINLYDKFKQDIEALSKKYGAEFANLEDTVTSNVWGTIKNGAGYTVTDIFHFSAKGHSQFAEALHSSLTTSNFVKNK